jgi:hypothetical protein
VTSRQELTAALAVAARDRPRVQWSAYPPSSLWSDYRHSVAPSPVRRGMVRLDPPPTVWRQRRPLPLL